MGYSINTLTSPLCSNFVVSSTIMLNYGFLEIRYEIIEMNDYVDGLFYFKDDDIKYINDFTIKLQEAQLSSLIKDFDYIECSCDRIILRKYKNKELKEKQMIEDNI